MGFQEVSGTRAPVRVWTDPATVDRQAMAQLRNVAELPWVDGVAVMPDVHVGTGATVGSVVAMRQAVCPAAVGVDIGCGMTAVRTSLTDADLPTDLARLRKKVEDAVPVGTAVHRKALDPHLLHGLDGDWDDFWADYDELHPGARRLRGRSEAQLGTLGSGNHFIEICIERDGADAGRVWLMLHSGSRGIGRELAERHMEIAARMPHNADLPDRNLAVFVADTPEMSAYRRDLFWAQEYAHRSRQVMMALVRRAVRDAVPRAKARFDEPISCHHNYVAEESYGGRDLLVTRKGAIRAGAGELGIIPGSMGTSSYIVRGLGNPDAYCSASHGAGRRMSRGDAKNAFTLADLRSQTAGVECRKDSGVVDEIPGAYKDIDRVMADQTDLVEIVAHLKQVVCVKG
jgi:tRNA-splicing ligase RtcB